VNGELPRQSSLADAPLTFKDEQPEITRRRFTESGDHLNQMILTSNEQITHRVPLYTIVTLTPS
jgi:hypothetical protein